jgi:hypothetical protein
MRTDIGKERHFVQLLASTYVAIRRTTGRSDRRCAREDGTTTPEGSDGRPERGPEHPRRRRICYERTCRIRVDGPTNVTWSTRGVDGRRRRTPSEGTQCLQHMWNHADDGIAVEPTNKPTRVTGVRAAAAWPWTAGTATAGTAPTPATLDPTERYRPAARDGGSPGKGADGRWRPPGVGRPERSFAACGRRLPR